MKILITGVAGFIGFNFAKYLVNKNFTIYGIDNFDDYYSVKFKVLRLKELKKKDNFFFKKVDITKKNDLKKYFKKKNFDLIFHFAAQAVSSGSSRGSRAMSTNPVRAGQSPTTGCTRRQGGSPRGTLPGWAAGCPRGRAPPGSNRSRPQRT